MALFFLLYLLYLQLYKTPLFIYLAFFFSFAKFVVMSTKLEYIHVEDFYQH